MRRRELKRFPTWTVGASGEGHVAYVEQESAGCSQSQDPRREASRWP